MSAVGDRGSGRPTWAEIDLAALERNLELLRAKAGERRVIAVVKADGYGHGARIVGTGLVGAGCDALAVATVAEAAGLRASGLKVPILLLQGLHANDEADFAHEQELAIALGRVELVEPMAAAADRHGRPFPVHLKFDTGMTRLGFAPEEVDAVLDRVLAEPGLRIEGIMSHLACADEPDTAETREQRERFAAIVARARTRGVDPAWIHLDNSPAVLHGPSDGTTAVRPGLALYGADPTRDGVGGLTPVMALVSRVAHAQDVPAGQRVGYGGTFTSERPTRIATLPLGYADGLPRAASGGWAVSVGGRSAPLVGQVSMDLCTIDTGPESGVSVGDEVLVFGQRHGQTLPVEKLAELCGSISYEVFVNVGSRVPRVALRRSARRGVDPVEPRL